MALSVRSADEPTLRLFDGALVAWMTLWVVVGVFTGMTLWQAADIGDTLRTSGEAIGSAGSALEDLGSVPLVGDRPAELGAETRATGAEISARGPAVKSDLRRLALLLGLSVALIPTTPVLGLYVPLRLARRRETRSLRRSLRSGPRDEAGRPLRDPALDGYLAQRALQNLPYADVRRLVAADAGSAGSTGPAGPVDPGDPRTARRLADAELARLGIRLPRG